MWVATTADPIAIASKILRASADPERYDVHSSLADVWPNVNARTGRLGSVLRAKTQERRCGLPAQQSGSSATRCAAVSADSDRNRSYRSSEARHAAVMARSFEDTLPPLESLRILPSGTLSFHEHERLSIPPRKFRRILLLNGAHWCWLSRLVGRRDRRDGLSTRLYWCRRELHSKIDC